MVCSEDIFCELQRRRMMRDAIGVKSSCGCYRVLNGAIDARTHGVEAPLQSPNERRKNTTSVREAESNLRILRWHSCHDQMRGGDSGLVGIADQILHVKGG